MKSVRVLITFIFLFSLLSSLSINEVQGYTLVDRSVLKLDPALAVKDKERYSFPKKILISRVYSPGLKLDGDGREWVKNLYYYFVTRLKFADLPYNYLVDREGNVYKGRLGFEGVVPELKTDEGAILIGYLSNSYDLPIQASSSLGSLVRENSFKYGISRSAVQSVSLKLEEGSGEGELGKLSYQVESDTFHRNLLPTLNSLTYYSKSGITFKGKIENLQYSKSVKAGSKIQVKFTLKNSGDVPWFTQPDFIYLTTTDGKDSPFAENKVWDSFDAPLHIEGKTILPGESVELKFNLDSLLLPGTFSESFKFVIVNGNEISGARLSLRFTVEKGNFNLLRVKQTSSRTLNVREGGYPSAKIIGQVDSGKLYIWTKKEIGWYRIKYSGDREGWVYGEYIDEVR